MTPKGSYYGLPALKAPVWTWEVPLYFFLGGISGVAGCFAFLAHCFSADAAMIRLSLWIALGGAAICPMLLIADLGRPKRFLYMLRVFKPRSPMSMGVWILVAFSGCAFAALAANLLEFPAPIGWIAEGAGAITGLLLAGYTGVLIGATAIPVWFTHRRFLPMHFLVSGLGSFSGILELCGFLVPVTWRLGLATAMLETAFETNFSARKSDVDRPLHHGRSGWLFRVAWLLEGPVAFGVRMIWRGYPGARYAAAICFMVGALMSRYAWIWAGHASAMQPEVQFAQQRGGGARP